MKTTRLVILTFTAVALIVGIVELALTINP